MIWHIIRYWITFLIPTFYKRIQGKNVEFLNVKGPVILAMNHPNAFTDPICISWITYPLRVHYMARGDAFKPGLIAYLLEKIGIVPIFRMRDGGKEGLKKNDEAYRRVNQLLARNAKIIVFAEGLCIQERRLRPLKKGLSRMVFGAYESLLRDDLLVIPVGVNYSKPDKFRSMLFYNFGEPIHVKDFIAEYRENPARANTHFLQFLEPRMKELITHIKHRENDEVVAQVDELCKKNWLKQKGLNYKNLHHDFIVSKEIVELVNRAAETKQPELDEFKALAGAYFKKVKTNKLRDWLIDPQQSKFVNYTYLSLRIIVILIGCPLYLVGMIANFPPLYLTHRIARSSIKNVEFYSSIALGVAMIVFPLIYSLWFMAAYYLAPNILFPMVLCTFFVLTGWFCLCFHPFILKTLGMARVLTKAPLARELSEERRKLLSLINKF